MPNYRHIKHNDMRNQNLALILNYLHQYGPISRVQLSKALGMNKASISTTVRELIDDGIVIELGVQGGSPSVGHPSIDIKINPDAGRVLAVDVLPDRVAAVVTDVAPNILWRHEAEIPEGSAWEQAEPTIREVVDLTCREARSYDLPILGLAMSLPGIVDIERDILLDSTVLGWKNIDLTRCMQANEDIPFYSGNEAHIAALGDCYFGNSRDAAYAIYISLGKGISAGILVNQNVVPGGLGFAGEVGHLLIDPLGEQCQCGTSGCWNLLVNQDSILKRIHAAENGGSHDEFRITNLAGIIQAAQAGEPQVLAALAETGKWLGYGIASLINLLNPECITIGGRLSQVYDYFASTLLEEVKCHALPWQREGCVIAPSRYLQDATLIGGVATVIWNILNDPGRAMPTNITQRIFR